MNAFDQTILHLLNSFAQRSSFLDRGMMLLANGTIAKASFVGLFLWYPWLEKGERGRKNREIIVATVFGCFLSIGLCLVLQKLLPYRVRPVQNADLGFIVPLGQEPLRDWPSAFPSDHSMLFATLATAAWFVSRPLGVASHVFAFLFIGVPRVYLGLHHPTDILAGAAMGILVAAGVNRPAVRAALSRWPLRWHELRPGLVSAGMFLLFVQIASVFWEARVVADALARSAAPALQVKIGDR
ncbi:MAG: phosphatase PAP2 family protein [Anaeromyxobacteraceae bacterium]